MKKIMLMLAFTFSLLSAKASHLMGGDLILQHDSNGYRLHHTNYRDMFGIPALATTTVLVYVYDAGSNTWLQIGSLSLPMDASSSFIQLSNVPYGVETYNYYSMVGELDSMFAQNGTNKKYKFITNDCCRNAAINNMGSPSGESLVLTLDYYLDSLNVNNTPQFLNIPVIYGPINAMWTYNPLPYDADGDSLSWEVNTPQGSLGGITGNTFDCVNYVLPSSATSGPFTLNNFTGELTWTPNVLGNSVASFKIHEYRNGIEIGAVVRDMQYIVISDSTADTTGNIQMPRFAASSAFNYNNIQNANYIYYTPNVPLSFSILGQDDNTTDVLSMSANSELFLTGQSNAAFTSIATGVGNEIKGTLNWTPKLTDSKDKIVAFRISDGMLNLDFSLMLKKSLVPEALTDKNIQNTVMQIVPNTITNGIITIHINSKTVYNNSNLQILDITGKVLSANTIDINNQNVIVKNIIAPAGLYFAKITTGHGLNITKRFVVK
jgi:hypothetical protein